VPIGALLGDKKSLKTHKVNQGLLYVISILPGADPMIGLPTSSTWQLHVQHRKPNKAALAELIKLRDERHATAAAVAEAEAAAGPEGDGRRAAGKRAAGPAKLKWTDPLELDAQAARAAASAESELGVLSLAGANEPVWPPEQMLFQFGAAAAAAAGAPATKGKPTLTMLLHQLAASSLTRPSTTPSDIRVAKYNPSRKLWIPLAEPASAAAASAQAAGTDEAAAAAAAAGGGGAGASSSSSSSSSGGGGGGGGAGGKGKKRGKGGRKGGGKAKGKIQTLRDAPYGVNNGDLIAFCYVSEDPTGADDWMRAEDFAVAVQESDAAAEARSARATGHARWSGSGATGGKARPRRVERALSLGSEDSYILDDGDGGEEHERDAAEDDDDDQAEAE
jgi:hypothetical protein